MPTLSHKEEYLNALLKGNRHKAYAIAEKDFARHKQFKDLYENLMKPALYEVGALWEQNKISVATEHLATAVTESLLNRFYEEIELKEFTKKVVLACVPGELHQVGLRMVADVFEHNGWDSYFTGANVPQHELVSFIQETDPDMLAVSLSVFHNYSNLLSLLQLIRDHFPELKVIVGGQAFSRVKLKEIGSYGIKPFTDLHELDHYLKTLN